MTVMGRLRASPVFLGIRLLGHFESVIDFDIQISYGALQARMAQQQLHRSQIFCAPVDDCWLRPAHRVRAVWRRV